MEKLKEELSSKLNIGDYENIIINKLIDGFGFVITFYWCSGQIRIDSSIQIRTIDIDEGGMITMTGVCNAYYPIAISRINEAKKLYPDLKGEAIP